MTHKKSRKNPNPKNKKLSDIASLRTGEKNSFWGRHHTDETKLTIGKHNSKPVVMLDAVTHDILYHFSSITEASKYLADNNITHSSAVLTRISRVCVLNDDKYMAYGFGWKFEDKV